MIYLKCNTCNLSLESSLFYSSRLSKCKNCIREYAKISNKKYREKNIEKVKKSSSEYSKKRYKEKNIYIKKRPEKIVDNSPKVISHIIINNDAIKKVRIDLHKARKIELKRIKHNELKEKARIKSREKRRSCHKHKIRKTISESLKRNGYTKNSKSFEILGCEYEVFKKHIERQFTDGMNWDNYGIDGWHYDHIMPLSTSKSYEDTVRLNHYTNLRPLWAKDNLYKSDNIIEHQVKLPI